MKPEMYLKDWTEEDERLGLVQTSVAPNPEYVEMFVRELLDEDDWTARELIGALMRHYKGAANPKTFEIVVGKVMHELELD